MLIDNLNFALNDSRFFEKGLNVMEVATITGHKDLRMLQRYAHLRAVRVFFGLMPITPYINATKWEDCYG